MHPIQAMLNGMNQQWQKERAETQMTLGKMIDELKAMPSDAVILGLGELDSYRGYYSDLAFEPTSESKTAEELLAICQGAMGQVFTGYKGGEYMMGANTPLWLSHYGTTGVKIMAINTDGTIDTATDD